MARDKEDIYLGVSLKYPPAFDTFGLGATVGGRESVFQSIKELLETPLGTNFFLPERGSRLDEIKFEPNDSILKDLLRLFIFEAIEMWEKRVNVLNVDFEFVPDQPLVNCEIFIQIRQSNEVDSFIFPFYRELEF